MAVDLDTLRKLKVQAKTIDVPGVGEFRYRGLTRAEMLGMQPAEGEVGRLDIAESKLLALCVVEPEATEAEWAEISGSMPAGLLSPLVEAISSESGADPEAAKQAYQRFRG